MDQRDHPPPDRGSHPARCLTGLRFLAELPVHALRGGLDADHLDIDLVRLEDTARVRQGHLREREQGGGGDLVSLLERMANTTFAGMKSEEPARSHRDGCFQPLEGADTAE